MNNLIIAAMTFVMLPAFATTASGKNLNRCREAKSEIVVEKMNFDETLINTLPSAEPSASVDVDYIIDEEGKGYITYISSSSEDAKKEVVQFIENTTYHFNIVPGKVYSMKLTLNK